MASDVLFNEFKASVAQKERERERERRRYILVGEREGGFESTILVFALYEMYAFDFEANWNGSINHISYALIIGCC